MLAVPSALRSKFDERLRIRSIPDNMYGPYQKWLSSERLLTSCGMRRIPSARTRAVITPASPPTGIATVFAPALPSSSMRVGVKSSESADEPAIGMRMLCQQVRIGMNW